jgi:hypothetical protein
MKMSRATMWVAVSLFCAASAYAQKGSVETQVEGLLDSVKNGCETEIATHCKDVTPGEGRTLACLFSYRDKLSTRCEYALYDASSQLERLVAKLSYVSSECGDDIQKHCAGTTAGEGRIRQCLDKNAKQLSSRCSVALRDVGKE